jgi:phosphatidylglycerol:prolipoprotein diacylglycerol transferase
MEQMDIAFPHLGIYLKNVPQYIMIGSFPVAMYGIMIALAMLSGLLLASHMAKKTGLNPDTIWDIGVYLLVLSVVGARIYYVIFMWDMYKDNLLQIFNLRGGGLAIYGGIIGGITTVAVYSKIKKVNVGLLLDTCAYGLVLGQIIGRWGNFFNREVFGGYTDSLLAMKFPASMARASDISEEIAAHMTDGCIQVHPTFLYEGIWNFCLLMLLIFALKYRKFHGQIILLYLMGYGIGRALIETIRTDQLFIPGTTVPVNMVMGICVAIAAFAAIVIGISRAGKKEEAEKA